MEQLHPWCQQRELVQYCKNNGIVVEAYSPLCQGKNLSAFELDKIAAKHNRSPAQILIRWSLQKGWVPLVKSQNSSRIEENMDVYGYELEEEDMKTLDSLDQGPDGARFPANVSHGLE